MELNIYDLNKNYGKKQALKDFTFSFEPGIYGLLGPNGAGKSTLMNILTDNVKRSSGRIEYNGTDIEKLGDDFRKRIGYMPQQQNIFPDFSLSRFLHYMAALKGMKKSGLEERIVNVCESVNLKESINAKLGTFSGGMRQRALLAQAILDDPEILILDEPTAGLDPKERISLRNLISDASRDKIVILATHIVSDIDMIADKVILLDEGSLKKAGTPDALCEEISGSVFERRVGFDDGYGDIDKNMISAYRKEKDCVVIRYINKSEQKNDLMVNPGLEDVYLYYFGI